METAYADLLSQNVPQTICLSIDKYSISTCGERWMQTNVKFRMVPDRKKEPGIGTALLNVFDNIIKYVERIFFAFCNFMVSVAPVCLDPVFIAKQVPDRTENIPALVSKSLICIYCQKSVVLIPPEDTC